MPASDTTLSLFAPLPGKPGTPIRDWRIAFACDETQSDCGYAEPGCDDAGWETVTLPHLSHATPGQDTLWYRAHFAATAPADRRLLLRLGGAFYHTTVWLNGTLLGAHEGYFQPFGFDITDRLQPGDNVVAVRCHFPVEAGTFKRKTTVTGIFADWDCKPYPSLLYPNLPAPHEWTVPLGLWQPVTLHTTGPVLVECANVFPHMPASPEPGAAQLRVVLDLRNLSAGPQDLPVSVAVSPHNFKNGAGPATDTRVSLLPHEARTLELELTLESPRLWYPWTHGEPALYRASVRVGDDALTRPFGVRHVTALEGTTWCWRLNGRPIFPRGSSYVADLQLDRVTPEGLDRDLDLARGANLDLLRVHAHIAPDDLYRLCDERGLMVMCDFPLIWTYAYGLRPEEQQAFEASVCAQAQDMVRLLGSHPSIVLWSLHNEPPWTPDGRFLGADVHDSATNRALDESAAARVQALDPTRPALAASGELDQHVYFGWYQGHWQDNREQSPPFPTEFGVQALPSLDTTIWDRLNTAWPVPVDDPSWAHAGYQSVFWTSPGIGTSSQYRSLAAYVAESQAYQAFYTRYVIDQWRRRKFDPTAGYIHFLFADGWPGITWSVLSYERKPKAAYAALAEASRPVHVCLDVENGFTVERGFHLVYPEDGHLQVGLYLVNDDYRRQGRVTVRWWLEHRGGWLRGLRAWLRRRFTSCKQWINLPHADERALPLTPVDVRLPHAGRYTLRVETTQGSRVLDRNSLDFRVGEERPDKKRTRHVPRWLVRKVYVTGSLRATRDGFTFALSNPAMHVILLQVERLLIDGTPLDLARVELAGAHGSRRAAAVTPETPLEFEGSGRLNVNVHGHTLTPGAHVIEVTLEMQSFGEITAKIEDNVPV